MTASAYKSSEDVAVTVLDASRFEWDHDGPGLFVIAKLASLINVGRHRMLQLLLLLGVLCGGATAQIQDFSLRASGSHHVVQGHYLFFNVVGTILAGTSEPGTVVSVSGLPSGATATFVDQVRYCCGPTLYWITDANPIKISTSPSTPVGQYSVVVTYTTGEGLQRSTTHDLFVDPTPSLAQKPQSFVAPDTPLASLAQWNSNMVKYGRLHCTVAETSEYSGYNVDFYDGTRVYYQIADATGDVRWNDCADMVYTAYSKYVHDNNGGVAGYHLFPHGIAMRFRRTGDVGALQTLASLETNSAYTYWQDTSYIIDYSRSREVSYAIETNLQYQSLGGPINPHLQDLIEAQIGHFDQWFQSKTAPIAQPFMVALAAEALIEYWDVSKDPRIPGILQLAADEMWANSFKTGCECFPYYNDEALDGTYSLTTDLNIQVAPLYGWLYQRTGAQVYRDEGDRIFNSGVAGAWLDGGKQFSQNYRWGGKYIEWRAPPAQPALGIAFTSPATGASYKASSSPLTISGTASGQNITQIGWISDHGGSGTATGTSSWNASGIALQTGLNLITVYVYDAAGNQASATLAVTLEWSTRPQITAVSASPSDGAGSAQTFTFVFADSQSSNNFTAAAVLFAETDDGQNACFVVYDRNRGTVQLEWDNLSGAESRQIGSSVTLENSQCAIGPASVTADTFSTTLSLNITFKSTFRGLKNIYMYGADGAGAINTGWVQKGTWTPSP